MPENTNATRAGGCLCRAVRFEAHGAPAGVAACHCRSCRRHTGAPFAVYADYQRAMVEFTGAEAREFSASAGAMRGFCGDCGSTLYFRGANLPDMIHIHAGAFDEAELFVPTAHENIADRLPWLDGPS